MLAPAWVTADRTNSARPRLVHSITLDLMESKIAKEAERALIEATQRLSPEERLNAYLQHCRLMMELYEAGLRMRSQPSPNQSLNENH